MNGTIEKTEKGHKFTCECGKSFEKESRGTLQGAINLHKNIHCPLKYKKGEQVTMDAAQKSDCLHSWVTLDQNYSKQRIAIEKGYKECCKKCLELR